MCVCVCVYVCVFVCVKGGVTSDSKWLGGGRLKTLFSVNFFNFQKSGRGGEG